MYPLANDLTIVYRSKRPKDVHCYTPGIAITSSRRIVATLDLGGDGVKDLPGPKGSRAGGTRFGMGKVYVSDDGGQFWIERCTFPFWHARPFIAGERLYVLGHAGDLMIIASDDEGETWSAPITLSSNIKWHGSSCNVDYSRQYVYLALDERRDLSIEGWNTAGLAPRVLRGRIDQDLLDPNSWTVSESLPFNEIVSPSDFDLFGIPFYSTPLRAPAELGSGRLCAPMGWLEPNIVRFHNPAHLWHDPSGRTLHLFLRTNTGGTGYAALVKVVEHHDGRLTTALETVPSGKKAFLIPLPGGHLKFFLLFDSKTGLYWLLSSQPTDSMVRLTHMPQARYNLPNNERHRLQLHFSRNCIDWCFAGLVTVGETERHSRNYASMAVDGDDLLVLCRSGDDEGRDSQYTNLITFHRIKDFRRLVH
ncbi:exo-alpha-sialidase [Sinorhizobium meliloti]|uniref:sialidase family protein n=1 Tax=Rhizobium meliloti TaxID=382 RepID=UPI0023807276|nr:sialidase family protein [Sinorhizobium meliloti]MDE3759826.1 exo-alpha-sialidase [Sinorhizobium meliloti]